MSAAGPKMRRIAYYNAPASALRRVADAGAGVVDHGIASALRRGRKSVAARTHGHRAGRGDRAGGGCRLRCRASSGASASFRRWRTAARPAPGDADGRRSAAARPGWPSRRPHARVRPLWMASCSSHSGRCGTPAAVPQAVAQALGIRESFGRAYSATVALALGERRLLLMLDNFEHLLDGRSVRLRMAGGLPTRGAADDKPRAAASAGRARVSGAAAEPEQQSAWRDRDGGCRAAVRRAGA